MLRVDINLLFTVINLLILVFVVWKFLLKPVNKIIQARQEEAEQGFKEAQEKQKEAEEIKANYEMTLKGADMEKEQILKDCRTQAGKEYDRVLAEAREDAEKIVEEARKAAHAEKQHALKEAQEEIANLVAEATEKIAAANTKSPERDRELYDQFIEKRAHIE